MLIPSGITNFFKSHLMNKNILILILFVTIIGCQKNTDQQGSGVLIKGTIGNGGKGIAKSSLAANSLSLSDAKRVLIIFGDQSKISEINNNSFSVNVPGGSATALIFVDADNHYIGNLSVSGLNILPLVNLSEGENTVIDLSTLTLLGTSVIPSNNPIGTSIMITEEDIAVLKEIGSFYEAIAKNIDTDNDGVPDNFDGKQIIVNSQFSVAGGKWGLNSSPAAVVDMSQLIINYGIRIKGWKNLIPQNLNISLTGPEGDPYSDIQYNGYNYQNNCGCFDTFFSRYVNANQGGQLQPPFRNGVYTFTMDGTNKHTINYASISATQFLVIAVPVVKTSDDGKITRVEIEYMLPDKTPVECSKYVTTLMIQFGSGTSQLYQEGRIFDLMNVLPDFKNVSISKDVYLKDVTGINIGYTDLVGNVYNISWMKP